MRKNANRYLIAAKSWITSMGGELYILNEAYGKYMSGSNFDKWFIDLRTDLWPQMNRSNASWVRFVGILPHRRRTQRFDSEERGTWLRAIFSSARSIFQTVNGKIVV